MNLARYQSYKDSRVEWMGEVPSHWSLRSLRYSAKINNGSGFQHDEVLEGEYPVLGSGGEFARTNSFMYDKPSVLLGRKGTIDNPLFIEEPFWTVDTLFYTEIAQDTLPKYFYYFCKTIPFDFFQYGSTVPSMTQSDLYSICVPSPDLVEQEAIASFLDRETTKLDKLIGEQQCLIKLLKEKRQAIIIHAVTKGLNPSIPMTDSGVEWLGKVPEHWTVTPLKKIGQIKSGTVFPNTEQGVKGEKLSFYKVKALAKARVDGILLPSENTISYETAKKLGAFIFPPLSIVFAKVGAALFLGRVRSLDRFACIDNNMVGLVVQSDYHIPFILYAMSLIAFDFLANPGAIPSLNETQIGNYSLVIPQRDEQQKIAAYLDRETAKINTLMSEVDCTIKLLQERRSALIYAAVTGKVDVRDRNLEAVSLSAFSK